MEDDDLIVETVVVALKATTVALPTQNSAERRYSQLAWIRKAMCSPRESTLVKFGG